MLGETTRPPVVPERWLRLPSSPAVRAGSSVAPAIRACASACSIRAAAAAMSKLSVSARSTSWVSGRTPKCVHHRVRLVAGRALAPSNRAARAMPGPSPGASAQPASRSPAAPCRQAWPRLAAAGSGGVRGGDNRHGREYASCFRNRPRCRASAGETVARARYNRKASARTVMKDGESPQVNSSQSSQRRVSRAPAASRHHPDACHKGQRKKPQNEGCDFSRRSTSSESDALLRPA